MDATDLEIRDASEADMPALVLIKGEGSEPLHRDRFRDAAEPGFQYLVVCRGEEVVGFGCLVSKRPSYWSDADDTEHLPCVIDLQVAEAERGKGYGAALIRGIEVRAAKLGFRELHIAVQPRDNPRAHALYRRLGYRQIQAEPYLKSWEFTDSGGEVHHGEDWLVDMVKLLL